MSKDQNAKRTHLRVTRRRVRFFDSLSKTVITVGGIGTIFSVVTVCVFLVFVVCPIFQSGEVETSHSFKLKSTNEISLAMGSDEHRLLSWDLDSNGIFNVYHSQSGQLISKTNIGPTPPVKVDHNRFTNSLALCFSDGRIKVMELISKTSFFERRNLNKDINFSETHSSTPFTWEETQWDESDEEVKINYKGVIQKIPSGQYRAKNIELKKIADIKSLKAKVVDLDHIYDSDQQLILAQLQQVASKFVVQLMSVSDKTDMLSGKSTRVVRSGELVEFVEDNGPRFVRIVGNGHYLLVVWQNGLWERFAIDDLKLQKMEEGRAFEMSDSDVSCVEVVLGEETLFFGSYSGEVESYFLALGDEEQHQSQDGFHLYRSKKFRHGSRPIKMMTPSKRSRIILIVDDSGLIAIYQTTSQKKIVEINSKDTQLENVAITPKDDGVLARDNNMFLSWDLDVMYPEVSFTTLFNKIHYEGYKEEKHMWQSSSGTDASEGKFGLMPLIFGTLKATFYSLIFGAPLALLAALFSSEFLNISLRKKIKPLIEMMASLPSVVLGFLAALYFAPLVESYLAQVLTCVIAVPLSFMLGGCVLQFFSMRRKKVLDYYRFPFYLFVCLPIGIFCSFLLFGNVVENIFFLGDLKNYLHGHYQIPVKGSALGGWMILLFPLSLIASFVFFYRYLEPYMKERLSEKSMKYMAVMDLLRFVITLVFALLVSLIMSSLFGMLGDLRGPSSLIDTYVQRNALVVGFIMGFSIIPIIYSIAEDALTAVPDHLRAASYGAGATKWQTAIRIVIPTAMSGLFAACMVGLGRAVGETMIVLMAAGNTPVMEMNIFNGFRTLSANIAVELPEAVQGSTHYRVLFLAALVLFGLTFLLNTGAEIVRMRFRKKTFQL